jgi:hypothetical protein
MEKNQEKTFKEFQLVFREVQYETAEDFLKNLIKNITFIIEKNFEYILISIHEGPEPSKSGDLNNYFVKEVGNYIENQEIFKEIDIDFEVFAFNIITFTYFIILDKRHGKTFNNHEDVINKFISYSARCIEH